VRYELVSGKEYPVYSQKEADELGLSYKHPFEVSEGEYGISSDKEVAICLKKSEMKSKTRLTYKVKYPWGPSFTRSTNDKIKSLDRPNNYGSQPTHRRTQSIKKKHEWQKMAHLMAQPGMKTNEAIKLVHGNVTDAKRWNIRKTMRTEVFKEMTKEELDKLVAEFPIGQHDTARALAQILDKSMDYQNDESGNIDRTKPGDKYDSKAALAIADKLMDFNSMKSKNKTITTKQIEASTVESTLADIQQKKKLFKATQTEVTDGVPKGSEEEKEEK